jgi:HNH endonuclease
MPSKIKFGSDSPHWQGGKIRRICMTCSKEFFVDKNEVIKGHGKFCSRSCTGKRNYGHKKIVPRIPLICVVCGKIKLYRITDFKRESNRGRCCSINCRVIYTKRSISGNKNYRWLGGKTKLNRLERSHMDTRKWSSAIKKRDNYTCKLCGIKNHKGLGYSLKLHAHHIKSWVKYPKLRHVFSNGITYCLPCHKIIHGRKNVK